MAKAKVKYFCTSCGDDKAVSNFYMSHSKLYEANDKRFPVCKDCMITFYEELVNHYASERLALYHFCLTFNIYFEENLMESAYAQASTTNSSLVRIYMQKVGSLMQYKGKTSLDGEHLTLEGAKKDFTMDDIQVEGEYVPPVITSEIIRRWGSDYTNEEYILLETYYQEFIESYQHDTPAEKLIFRNICKTILESERARKTNNFTAFEKLNASISKLMTDGGIKPIQTVSVTDDDNATWGKWIAIIENERPIPTVSDEFKDVDKIGKYIDKWFTKQMKRVLGLEKKESYISDN